MDEKTFSRSKLDPESAEVTERKQVSAGAEPNVSEREWGVVDRFAPAFVIVGPPVLSSVYENRKHGGPPDEMVDKDGDGKDEQSSPVTR